MVKFAPLNHVLSLAEKRGIAIGAFEFWSYEVARAIIEAAEEVQVPVILQCGKTEIDRMGGMEGAVEVAARAIKAAKIPVVLHLDHATNFEYCCEAINTGFSSVMIDASAQPFEDNIRITAQVVDRARPIGISVEGELGRLLGEENDIVVDSKDTCYTDPDDAVKFYKRTGVDALAVSIGTAHGLYTFEPELNLKRLEEIYRRLNIPIVLHGGSGTPTDQIQSAIHKGIRKINICTDIQVAMGKAYEKVQSDTKFKYTAENLWGAGEAAAKELVKTKMRIFALIGR